MKEQKQAATLCDLKFREVDIDGLERSKLSAKEAKLLELTRVDTSTFATKVLYETIFPPHLKGETRYLHGPKTFGSKYLRCKTFPDFLITKRYHKIDNEKPLFILAGRVDRIDTRPYRYPTDRDAQQYLKRLTDWFLDVAAGYCYCYQKDLASRNNASDNIARRKDVRLVLGSDLDVMEFMWLYYGPDIVTSIWEHAPGHWKNFSRYEAQPDIARAMIAGAQEALSTRSHYSCLKQLQKFVQECSYPIKLIQNGYLYYDWQAIHDREATIAGEDWNVVRKQDFAQKPRPKGVRLIDYVKICVEEETREVGKTPRSKTSSVSEDDTDASQSDSIEKMTTKMT